MKKIQLVWFFLKNIAELKLKDNVLIWIKGTPCIVPVEKAFAYKVAKEKGVKFENALAFEHWYTDVNSTSYLIGEPKEGIAHYGSKTIPLYWV